MYTLNEILTIIETQAAAHLQVKQYGQGDVWEINPKELDYLSSVGDRGERSFKRADIDLQHPTFSNGQSSYRAKRTSKK
jgi:hypothetical protein